MNVYEFIEDAYIRRIPIRIFSQDPIVLSASLSRRNIEKYLKSKGIFRERTKIDLSIYHDHIVGMYQNDLKSPEDIGDWFVDQKLTKGKIRGQIVGYLKKIGIYRNTSERSVAFASRVIETKRSNPSTLKCHFCDQTFQHHDKQKKYCLNCAPDGAAVSRIKAYGIRQSQYDALILRQKNSCALCDKDFSTLPKRNIHVDHCHLTGKVRGLLCRDCNQKLGLIEKHRFDNKLWSYVYQTLDYEFVNPITIRQQIVNPVFKTQTLANCVYHADCFSFLDEMLDLSIDMIYVDPPFGTQSTQTLIRKKKGQTISNLAYADTFADYVSEFLLPMIKRCRRVLKETGTIYLHLDQRHSHCAKILLDDIFGRKCFVNHIIWSYNYGGRGKTCFPKKHDDILVYSRTPGKHKFRWDAIDKIPYRAPELQKDPIRAAAGQVPTDVWDLGIIGTASNERVGYPTQKPIKLLKRAILASTDPDDIVLDACSGSGTTAVAAHSLNRRWIVIDSNSEAIDIIKARLTNLNIPFNFEKRSV